jgi:hypothetical protein
VKRSLFVSLIIAGLAMSLAPAQARSLPMITGGGHTQNNNSGGTPANQTAFGGFVAQATDVATDGAYPARGEVQARSAGTDDHQTVARVHGDVVCIANLGPADEESGGEPGEDVWEIRFRVERSDVLPPDVYGSIFVQDNGRDDYADENFDSALLTNPECGNADEYQLEPHQGQITVHD